MNIESTNLASFASSGSAVESASPVASPGADGGVVSEGFSGALVAQLELLTNTKTEASLSLQAADVVGVQAGGDPQAVATAPVAQIATQDFAALLGNGLPSSYKTKDDVDHQAALATVTDTLNYIAMGATAEQKAAVAEQNMKDVIAMAVPTEQNVATVSVEQNGQAGVQKIVPSMQKTPTAVAEAEQNQSDAAVTSASVQNAPVQLEQGSDNAGKKQTEGEAQVATAGDSQGAEALAAALVMPTIVSVEQAKTVNNLPPANALNEGGLLSFVKPSTGELKSNQSVQVSGDAVSSEAVLGQSGQDKPGFNLKAFDGLGQVAKSGSSEQQLLSKEGESAVSRVGADIIPLNKAVADTKVEVPAMTKPLSHPEWNKDLGERIVWMSNKAIPSAEIRLNPQHLGPISVRVDVADDQATVVFTAQHASVRETLEASIPKLREMMSAQQLNLAEVSVSQSPASDQGRSQSQSFADGRGQGTGGADTGVEGIDEVEQEIDSGRAVVSQGVLSLYA